MRSARMRGTDLGPWLREPPADEARLPAVHAEIGAKKLLAAGHDRLVCDLARDFCQLFDVGTDPDEHHDLSARMPERTAALRQQLDGWLADQATYERAAPPDPAREPLERGRLGDVGAAPALAALLAPGQPHRDEAAQVLLALPEVAAVRPAIRMAHAADPAHPVIAVLALRAGDASLAPRLAVELAGAEVQPRLQAEGALALAVLGDRRAVPLLSTALSRTDDEETSRRLIAALGASGDPRALPPLLAQLPAVRTRPDVVKALGRLGDRRAAPELRERIAHEPYVPARTEMARALGTLGDLPSVPVLRQLRRRETEQVVRDAIDEALARLGSKPR
jgi:hypothetical protein